MIGKKVVMLARILLVCVSVSSAFGGAQDPQKSPKQRVDRIAGNSAFALDLYSRLLEEPAVRESRGNLCVSPGSLAVALAMTRAGARGETEGQMAKVLCLPASSGGGEVRAFSSLNEKLQSANALWLQKGLTLRPEYLRLIRESYGGASYELDFMNALGEARASINNWTEKQTRGKIRGLLEAGDLQADTELVLTNALYFKEAWGSRFHPDNTKKRLFKVSTEKTIQVLMMNQSLRCGYARNAEIDLLQIPFASKDLSIVVLLPRESFGLEALEKSLSVERLSHWLSALTERKVGVYLPRFAITTRLNLKKVLEKMGMRDPFSAERADFSGMTGWKGLFIDDVIQQTRIEVNEDGAEAAAGSAVMMKKSGPVFVADHPFLFIIRDDSTGALFFMGRVVNPGK